MGGRFDVTVIVVGPLSCNCVIISDSKSKEAIIVDPGGDAKIILNSIELLNVSVKAIYHSHAHLDHCLATRRIKAETGASVHVHREDLFLWEHVEEQAKYIGLRLPKDNIPEPPDVLLAGNEEIVLGGEIIGKVIHTPGHSPGSSCYHIYDHVVCTGDTLFRDSVGRFDLWRSDYNSLKSSIQKKLYSLPSDLPVIPGHGPSTSIGRERESNQFIRAIDDSLSSLSQDSDILPIRRDDHDEEEGAEADEEGEDDGDEYDDDEDIEIVVDDEEAMEGKPEREARPQFASGGCRCCSGLVGFRTARM
ncbi:hypothetical protein HDU97_001478 [Phlyctochytrium planicorne]|nr:hypothetical protein HDU97_001478 [Phlyctochytrium planicorne]